MESNKTTVYDCSLLYLPKIHNRKGNITVVENDLNIPFNIKRVYYIYDIPGGEDRGAHAHKTLSQLIIAASGSFDILIDDGINKRIVNLNRPYLAFHLVPGIWRQLINFSSGAICLVLASDFYNELDYIRNYKNFLLFKSSK